MFPLLHRWMKTFITKSLLLFGKRNEKLVRISVNMARGRFSDRESRMDDREGKTKNDIFMSRFFSSEKKIFLKPLEMPRIFNLVKRCTNLLGIIFYDWIGWQNLRWTVIKPVIGVLFNVSIIFQINNLSLSACYPLQYPSEKSHQFMTFTLLVIYFMLMNYLLW